MGLKDKMERIKARKDDSARPKIAPRPKSAKPSMPPPRRKIEKVPVKEPEVVESVSEVETTHVRNNDTFIMDNGTTKDYMKELFRKKDRISKSDMFLYESRKSLFGKKIEPTKVLNILVVNETSLASTRFITVSPKIIMFSELNQLIKDYAIVKQLDREPTFVHKSALKDAECINKLKQNY